MIGHLGVALSSVHTGTLHRVYDFIPRASDGVHLESLQDLGLIYAGTCLLDLGCGSGFLVRVARNQGALVSVGVNIAMGRRRRQKLAAYRVHGHFRLCKPYTLHNERESVSQTG